MNGAESLVRSLIASEIEVCFSNPGTSEMHFVAALDKVPGMRCILGLHETVVTGAADGYARMAGKPAVTLLHTGPGLANGVSNLHNAKKARTPVVNVVGEHALSHIEHNAPLTADIDGIARPVSHWVKTSQTADELAGAGAEAVAKAQEHPGHIATLILPANTAWDKTTPIAVSPKAANSDEPVMLETRSSVDTGNLVSTSRINTIASALKADNEVCMVLGGHCLTAEALELADKVSQHGNVTLFAETFKARFQRGAGRVTVKEIPYPVNLAIEVLAPFKTVVLACAKTPVGFFAYPDKPSKLCREDADVLELAGMYDNGIEALRSLVEELGAQNFKPRLQEKVAHAEPSNGPLTSEAIGFIVANQLPHDAIVIDEAVTSGVPVTNTTASAAAHDWLEVCGGSIGGGMPLATGAAVACPDRKVVNLQADGSGMYSLQSLWTQAREKLNVTTIVFANSSYAILKHELENVQATSGRVALDMMELDRPTLNWVSMAEGMGVRAKRATTVDEFRDALAEALAVDGPFLVEAVI
ncbi:MAG: acetolactate synthase large subunit [Granulosicoccus sp.]